ncbi:MAG: dentilisin complex subunit PrcA [Treponema sp.]
MKPIKRSVFVLIGFLCFLGSCKSNVNNGKKELVELKISVFDSNGGSSIRKENAKLSIYNAGSDKAIFTGEASHGQFLVQLEKEKAYDFELEGYNGDAEKEKLAGSKIVNYYVDNRLKQNLTMLQFSLGMITRGVTPPSIVSVKDKATGKEITDGFEITDDVKTISIEFSSLVGGVEPVTLSGFGAKIAFGSVPNFSNGIVGNFKEPVFKDGVFTSSWEFNIDSESLKVPQGKTELVIVGYDVANNRIEKHINIKYAKTSNALSFGNGIYFKNLSMYIDRYPNYMGLFNLEEINTASPPPKQRDGGYTSGVSFSLKKPGLLAEVDVPIIGFDILRKKKDETTWNKVATRIYSNLNVEGFPKVHKGFDGDSSLQEYEDYEYKIVAFGETDKVISPVMQGKLLPSFTYSLYEPENFKQVSLAEAENLSYSCKVSGENFAFSKELADYINAGLLILDKQKNPEFGAKFRYYFDGGNGMPDVKIKMCGEDDKIETKSINEMISGGLLSKYGINNLSDLLEVQKDTLVIKSKFLKVSEFNVLPSYGRDYGINKPMAYKYGFVYEWDMQAEWGNPLVLNDDEALHIVKVLEFENPNRPNGHVYCRSFGNNKNFGSNAINGRFTFSITK